MAEEIRDLIEKINQDGIKAAEEKAQKIEAEGKQRADEMLARAGRESEELVAAALARIRREEESGKALLAQAARDMLLSLRHEILAMLDRIMVSETRQALAPVALGNLLSGAIRLGHEGAGGDIEIALRKEDLDIIEKDFLRKLQEEMKKNIILKPSEEISGGFIISFDHGKSCYDFTDMALAEYIGTHLKPKLNGVLREAIKE